MEAFQRIEKKGNDLRALASQGMATILGQTGMSAIVFHLGDASFSDSETLTRRIVQLFGSGASVLLDGMLKQANGLQDAKKLTQVEKGEMLR